jgi:hypothetical protein
MPPIPWTPRAVYHPAMAPAHARLGRPPSAPSTAPGDHHGRIGWLLRVNRLYGRDETAGVAADFARRLGGTSFGRAVNQSTVTRWEKGERPIPHQGLLGYEEVLDLPGRCLAAVAEAARSIEGAPPPRRPGGPGEDQALRQVEVLVDRAAGGDVMSGGDWTDLTGDLLAMPQVVLVPHRTWTALAERLLSEMIIAESTGWLQRNEALNNLIRQRDGAPAVVRAVTDLTNDRTNQVFVDPLTLLESVAHPEATGHLLRQLARPTNEHALRGAWCSVAEKIRRGHFTPPELEALSRRAAEVLADDAPHPSCRVAAAELLRQYEPGLPPGVVRVLQRAAAHDAVTRHVLRDGRMESAGAAATVVQRLARGAVGGLPRRVLDEDPTFPQLIEEMLFHPQISRRLLAAQFVEASPYREPLAAALLAELRGRRIASSPVSLVCAVLAALSTLGGQAARRVVQEIVLAPGLPSSVTEAAAWSLGHMRGDSPESFWLDALDARLGGPAKPASSTARGLVYGVGVSRNTAVLRQVSANSSHDPAVRDAARWWLRTPRHVLDSTGR